MTRTTESIHLSAFLTPSLVDLMSLVVLLALVLSPGLNEGSGIAHTLQECDAGVRSGHNYVF